MANYIVTAGSCQRKDLYATIVGWLTAAGWTNISSNPVHTTTGDGDVLTSPGTNGTQKLVLQLRRCNTAPATEDISLTTNTAIAIYWKMPGDYTPGANGVNGTIPANKSGIGATTWGMLYMASVAVPYDTVINYKYYADANGVFFSLEYPSGLAHGPVFNYLMAPATQFTVEQGSRALVLASSVNNNQGWNCPTVCDYPANVANTAAPIGTSSYWVNPPKNPNISNKYALSEFFSGDGNIGIRFKLDGFMVTPKTGLSTGDIIQIGSSQYYILLPQETGGDAFYNGAHPAIALRIA